MDELPTPPHTPTYTDRATHALQEQLTQLQHEYEGIQGKLAQLTLQHTALQGQSTEALSRAGTLER